MQLLDGIRHVSFDLWLTLIRSQPGFKPLRDELFARHFGIPRPLPEITAAFRHFDQLFNLINEKAGGNVHYTEMLYVILDYLGVSIDQIPADAMDSYYRKMEMLFFENHPVLIDPHTIAVLDALKEKGCTINILSNTGFILGSTLRQLLTMLGIADYFSFQLYSDEIGNSKPSPMVYERVLGETRKIRPVDKEEVLHVGDNPVADLGGARGFGFRSVLLDKDNTLRNLFLN
jgi:putative hydrolase of the HAD superfamily